MNCNKSVNDSIYPGGNVCHSTLNTKSTKQKLKIHGARSEDEAKHWKNHHHLPAVEVFLLLFHGKVSSTFVLFSLWISERKFFLGKCSTQFPPISAAANEHELNHHGTSTNTMCRSITLLTGKSFRGIRRDDDDYADDGERGKLRARCWDRMRGNVTALAGWSIAQNQSSEQIWR